MPPKRNPKSRTKNSNGGSSSSSSKDAELNAMAECVLPIDVVSNILSRLPVKPLVRFKSVCKYWYDLHSDPHFIKLHSRHFPLSPKTSLSFKSHLLKCPVLGIEPPRKLTFVDPNNSYEFFIDSCNGLICLGRPLFCREIVLWNPATNMWKTLPHSNAQFGATSIVSLGFGCNADGDDFKVVRINCLKGKKNKVGIEVYSSKSDSWRVVDPGFNFLLLEPKNHVIVSGNPYWVARVYNKDNRDLCANFLLGFDSTEMAFMAAPMPNQKEMGVAGLPFVAWGSSLGALACTKRAGDLIDKIDVWLFDAEEMKWSMHKSLGPIELPVPVDQCLECCGDGRIVGGCKDGRLFVYDPKNHSAVVSEMRRPKHCSFQILAYDERLAYVKGMVPVATTKEDHKEKYNEVDGFFVSSLHHRTWEITCYYASAF